MALAKVYDSEDTLMVPIAIKGSDRLSQLLFDAIVGKGVEDSVLLVTLADDIDNARTAAGLE